jgi:hypothetical protein
VDPVAVAVPAAAAVRVARPASVVAPQQREPMVMAVTALMVVLPVTVRLAVTASPRWWREARVLRAAMVALAAPGVLVVRPVWPVG